MRTPAFTCRRRRRSSNSNSSGSGSTNSCSGQLVYLDLDDANGTAIQPTTAQLAAK